MRPLEVNEHENNYCHWAKRRRQSTLLKTFTGLVKAMSGQIVFQDKEDYDLSTDQIVRKGIAFVPEGGRPSQHDRPRQFANGSLHQAGKFKEWRYRMNCLRLSLSSKNAQINMPRTQSGGESKCLPSLAD